MCFGLCMWCSVERNTRYEISCRLCAVFVYMPECLWLGCCRVDVVGAGGAGRGARGWLHGSVRRPLFLAPQTTRYGQGLLFDSLQPIVNQYV